jgi:sporulation protein YlmC with PRC-barrel domain
MKKHVVTVALAAALAMPVGAFAQQTAQPDQSTPAALTIASDSLLGTKVFDRDGKEVGTISKLMIDARQGKITSAIIKHGGRLGMGGKEISVPWDGLQLQRGQNQDLAVTMQQQFLEQAAPSQAERERAEREKQPSASPVTTQPEKK